MVFECMFGKVKKLYKLLNTSYRDLILVNQEKKLGIKFFRDKYKLKSMKFLKVGH